MGDGGYKICNTEGIHSITFVVGEWVDVFTRKLYRDMLLDKFLYCQQKKWLVIHAWCIMNNYAHLVLIANNNDVSEILRDFKKFTNKQIIKITTDNQLEKRWNWILDIFRKASVMNSRNSNYEFWRQDNQLKELFSEMFAKQNLDYIHKNPAEARIVEKAGEYMYSTLRDYLSGK